MARPRIDVAQARSDILSEAERLLGESDGRRLILSEIAARMGISQSYVHRFFRTKADLARSLAERWFDEVQTGADRVAALDLPAEDRLEEWVLVLLKLKRDRYEENSELFVAYLDLASDHMDLLAEHMAGLDQSLRRILREMVPEAMLDEATACVQDATAIFTVPFNIALFPKRATDERARAVIRVLRCGLREISDRPFK